MKSSIYLIFLFSLCMEIVTSLPEYVDENLNSIESLCNQDIYYNKEIQKVTLCPSNYNYIAVINDQHCIFCVKNLLKEIVIKYGIRYEKLLILYFSNGEYFSPISIREYLYGLDSEFQKENLYFVEYDSDLSKETLKNKESFYSMKTPVVYIRDKDDYIKDSSFLELK